MTDDREFRRQTSVQDPHQTPLQDPRLASHRAAARGLEVLSFEADVAEGFPNSSLPVLLYRAVFAPSEPDMAERFEALFARNGWPAQWRYGLFDFDHCHSTAHEALGVFRGSARARLGGPSGGEYDVNAGDVLILPAGIAHACVSHRGGFCMVGAYPRGQHWEVERGDPGALEAARARVAAVANPETDPLGESLEGLWR